jgi:hypothetical protein
MPKQFKSTKMGKGETKVVYSHDDGTTVDGQKNCHYSVHVLFPPIPKRRILAVTVWCAKLKRRVKPDTSVPSVWWRFMFWTVLGCITPHKIFK